jgi:voltage-gated potassium channel
MKNHTLQNTHQNSSQYRHGDNSLLLSSLLGIAIISIGTSGYMLIEGWSYLEAFYMTIITLTTVGFGEVLPLSNLGRVFTIFLIFSGVGGMAYFFSTLVASVVEGELLRSRGLHKMRKNIQSYSKHIIVCGCGRLGRIVVKDLIESGQNVVVVELGESAVSWLEKHQIPYVYGSAYEDDILKLAGIERAKTLLSLLPKDADNVYVTLCARDLNPELRIIARTEEEVGESKLLRAGANQVLAPYRVTGNKIVQQIIRPNVSEFLELGVGKSGSSTLAIEEVIVPKNSSLVGKTLEDAKLRDRTGIAIAAIIDSQGIPIFNPGAKSIIEAGSTMIVMGERTALSKLTELL